ncbi:MAG: FAD-dependent oxidoreductase [Actinomycetota bacterium]|nr:FAD-dependent oxidoreductase [Actinomycetota bacterium]
MERLVVVGADAAGMSAASQARRRRDPEDLSIVAFEKGNYTSYSACGIPYFVGGLVKDLERLIARTPERFRESYSIDARVRHEVVDIDLEERKVTVRDLDEGTESKEAFDQLVYSTGSKPIRPALQGAESKGIFGVQILDHGAAIYRELEEQQPQRAVIVGGGYIGLEMAEAFCMRGLHVSVVEMAAQPMSTLDPDMGDWVADAMRSMNIDVYTSEPAKAFESSNGRVEAVVTSERTIPADIVVLGLGVEPNTDLAKAAGIPIGPSGAVAVDQQMRTGVDGVWSAGDCAEKFHRVARKPTSRALGTHANKEGRVAGINLGGGYATFPGIVGTAASKISELEVARTGLKESHAEEAGFEYVTTIVDSKTRAGYYPGKRPIKTKMIVEKRSGRLLGAQIVGEEGAAKRIDVLATALWNEMTVDEMLNVDLSYAPPFAPVWDPVLIAARKAWELVEETIH